MKRLPVQSLKKLSLENILQPRYVAIALLAACLHTFGPVLPSFVGSGPRTAAAAEPTLPDVPQSLDVNDLLNLPEVPPSVGLDDEGYPQGAGRGYTPAQENPLLGKSVILTPMECAKKYGVQFCACTKLDDGRDACYHQTPSAGYYDLATCEMIWGGGQCQCDEAGSCFYPGQQREAKGMSCLDQIFFFPGESMECRKAGLMTVGNNCCKSKDESSNACGFENMASELGISDVLMTAISVGNTINSLTGITGTTFQQLASETIAKSIVNTWIAEGSSAGLVSSITTMFGGDTAVSAISMIEAGMADNVAGLTTEFVAVAGEQTLGSAIGMQAVAAVAQMLATMISIVSWIYMIYQIYNIVSQLAECTPGEMMLGCKRAKHVCHKVGNRCKIKIFGACLQDMEVYCCFNTQLARIIHEQGRSQLGLGWGSGKKPMCRGFYADEFVSLDFGRMDFGEYATELTKQMSNELGPKIEEAVHKAMDNFGIE